MKKLNLLSKSLFSATLLLGTTLTAYANDITLVAGGGDGGDGSKATQAKLIEPFAVGFDAKNNLYIVEMEGGERLRKVDRNGILTTIAGTGEKGFSGDGGSAKKAQIQGSHHILVLPQGDVLIADTFNNRVRSLSAKTGIITTIVGTGDKGFSGEGGEATKAQFGGIYCLALDAKSGSLYLCDLDNRRIRVLNKAKRVFTVAGNGKHGVPPDGSKATQSPLADPRAIALDSKRNLYILEREGDALRVVTSDGKIRTLIGAPNHLLPDSIGALKGPKHLCVDHQDNVIIADTENNRILKYNPTTGDIQQIAGSGKTPPKGASPTEDLSGSPLEINLNRPHGVFIHPDGSLYIADSENGRVIRIQQKKG